MTQPHIIARQPSPYLLGIPHLRRIKRDQLNFYHDMRSRHGDVVTMRLGPYRSHLLFHPDHIEALLARQWSSFIRFKKLMNVVRQWNGDSLLLAEGEAWRARRRKVMPAFQTKRLPDYGAMAVQETQALTDTLRQQSTDGRITLDTDARMARLTLDIATRTMFGAAPRENGAEIEQAIKILSATAFRESTSPLTLPDWLPTSQKADKRWAIKVMDDLVRGLVHDRMARGADGNQSDLLATLITEHNGVAEDIQNDVMSLLIAGHETSGALLSWVFTCLSNAPDWLAQVQHELATVVQGRAPTAADLHDLPILRAVIDETLRLFPPAYTLFIRQAEEDVDLLGVKIRKGDLVQIVPHTTHRDPRFFNAPDMFDPARFLQPPTWPKFAYFPFGAGPRVCIGQNFGLMESCLVVATLLQRMVPAPSRTRPVPLPEFSLRPRGGLRQIWDFI